MKTLYEELCKKKSLFGKITVYGGFFNVIGQNGDLSSQNHQESRFIIGVITEKITDHS